MQVYITSIGTAAGQYKTSQSDICEFMTRSLQMDEREKQKLRTLYRATGIRYRHSVIPDYSVPPDEYEFYPKNESLIPFPTTSRRLNTYKKAGKELAMKAVKNCLSNRKNFDVKDITHIITVSCTGMYAPGLEIDIVNELGLNKSIKRTSINFMGCYAAFNALKVARSFCSSHEGGKVLIVCLELCSLHFQNSKNEDDLLSAALFGDGAASVLVESRPAQGINFELVDDFCDILDDQGENMSWQIGDHGFEMRLSSYIPDLIKTGIHELIQNLFRKSDCKLSDIKYFVIHPGGKKILDVVEKKLGICRSENQESHFILSEYGNMSSPTVIFILEMLRKKVFSADRGEHILMLAFGPGLTLESFLLKVA